MKTIVSTAIAISLVTFSTLSNAGTASSLTRAQVKAELNALRDAGYDVAGDRNNYPEGIQVALMKLRSGDVSNQMDMMGVGMESGQMSASGSRTATPAIDQRTYRGS